MVEKSYPKEFLRGISSKDFVENGHVLQSAFQFDETVRGDESMRDFSFRISITDGEIDKGAYFEFE